MDLGLGENNQHAGNQAVKALGMIADMQESMLDAELQHLDNLNGKDLAKIREERMKEMKDRKAEEAEWSRNGHGHLTQLTETKEFFAACKNSKRLVCHFMRPTSHHCVALNGHMAKLAALHRETRFCSFDAEKSPYLCDKILADPEGNVLIPTVVLVVEGKVTYQIRGLAELVGGAMEVAWTQDGLPVQYSMQFLGQRLTATARELPTSDWGSMQVRTFQTTSGGSVMEEEL